MASMDVDSNVPNQEPQLTSLHQQESSSVTPPLPMSVVLSDAPAAAEPRENFKDIPVKVHIRKPERDTWVYVGRGIVHLDIQGHSAQVVVRSTSTNKVMTVFSEASEVLAEKRGNFVVVGCVEGSKVVSWSLNALNNSETLRLLASIELACYRCKSAVVDPRLHLKLRRKIDKVIKDDRRKRHRRRKDQDAMVDMFAKQHIHEPMESEALAASPP